MIREKKRWTEEKMIRTIYLYSEIDISSFDSQFDELFIIVKEQGWRKETE